jgi:2-dehydro-3-deoxygluconokinase
MGPAGCYLPSGAQIAPELVQVPIDTSGAGDAFNAGFLAARLKGAPLEAAALVGHQVAGLTIMRQGAIPPIARADYPQI